jgi:hypothetical protein
MPEYCIQNVDSDGRLGSAKRVECVDDEEAVQQASLAVDGSAIELWQGLRFVVRLPGHSTVIRK